MQERKQWKEIIEQAKTHKRVVELKKKRMTYFMVQGVSFVVTVNTAADAECTGGFGLSVPRSCRDWSQPK